MGDNKIIIKNNFPQQYHHVVGKTISFTPDETNVDVLVIMWLTNNFFCFIENPDLWVIYRVRKQNEKHPYFKQKWSFCALLFTFESK